MSPVGGLWALLLSSGAVQATPLWGANSRFEVSATAFASTPERSALCLGASPATAWEMELCGGFDRGLGALTLHGAWHTQWAFRHAGGANFTLGLGPAAGVRVMLFCPLGPCATGAGPEALVSLKAVEWLKPRLGLTLTFEAGLALLWTRTALGVTESMLRFPLHLRVGLRF